MQTVMVTKRSLVDKRGDAHLEAAKTIIQQVTAVYSDGRVLTSSGDVWRVEKCSSSKATFLAVA